MPARWSDEEALALIETIEKKSEEFSCCPVKWTKKKWGNVHEELESHIELRDRDLSVNGVKEKFKRLNEDYRIFQKMITTSSLCWNESKWEFGAQQHTMDEYISQNGKTPDDRAKIAKFGQEPHSKDVYERIHWFYNPELKRNLPKDKNTHPQLVYKNIETNVDDEEPELLSDYSPSSPQPPSPQHNRPKRRLNTETGENSAEKKRQRSSLAVDSSALPTVPVEELNDPTHTNVDRALALLRRKHRAHLDKKDYLEFARILVNSCPDSYAKVYLKTSSEAQLEYVKDVLEAQAT